MDFLGLDPKALTAVAKELNRLLADYTLHYQKTKNFHWNISGASFFDLHEKFEEMYVDAREKIDGIAERILTLGFQPTSNLSDYLAQSAISESPADLADREMVVALLSDCGKITKQMRSVVERASEAGDEGTIDQIGGYIGELEKTSWMLNAWLGDRSENLKRVTENSSHNAPALQWQKLLAKELTHSDLSARPLKCLREAGINTVGELVARNKPDLIKLKNFGKKSLTEVNGFLDRKGLQFGMDLTQYKRDGGPSK
ncbi:MAG: ferritin-like domain-containing protein [Flavobacteriales bacterium]